MESWIIRNKVDLQRPPRQSHEQPYLLMLPGDNKAHVWTVEVLSGGAPADLTGLTAAGYFLRRDGTGVMCEGTVDGNIVTVEFKAECYNVPGGMRGAVRLSVTGGTVTLADQAFVVQPTIDSPYVVEDEYIPSLADLLATVSRVNQISDEAMILLALNGITGVTETENGEGIAFGQISVTDEGAYAAAVAAGYEGTEEEWDEFVAMVTDNTSVIAQAEADSAAAIAAVSEKSTVTGETVTVLSTDWTGSAPPYTATVACTVAAADNILIVGVGGSLTDAQKKAFSNADILCTGQGAGIITLKAYFAKPTIDLPVNVIGVE